MLTPCTRRQFFGHAPAGAVAAFLGGEPPPRAWIVIEENWEYNDEFTYSVGELAHDALYYDRAAAEAACRNCNADFYRHQSPDDFGLDWSLYFPDGLPGDKLECDVTWDEVKAAGWTDPYFLRELTVPGVNPHE